MDNCIFCKIATGEFNAWKVYEDDFTLAFLDINPVTKYHTIVIPKQHFVNALDIPEDVFLQVMSTVKKVVNIYKEKLQLENLQIIHNAGKIGQQDVFHLHAHVVPRYDGDGQDIKRKTSQVSTAEFAEMIEFLR